MNKGDRGSRRNKLFPFIAFFVSIVSIVFPLVASHVPDEVLIKWKTPPGARVWQVDGAGISISKLQDLGCGWQRWALPRGRRVDDILGYVRGYHAVEIAEPNYIRHVMGRVPNDPFILNQKHLELIQAYGAWEFDVGTSTPTTIAVIDTGVDFTHVELSTHTVSVGVSTKIWTNPVDLPGGGDEDGNGRADDVNGWDFADNTNDVSDCVGHGTLVASIAAASTDNGVGIAGVSWGAKVLPLRVFPQVGCDNATSASIISAINYAVWAATASAIAPYTGRMVINMSLGCKADPTFCPESAAEKDAINLALANGIPVVISKGNFGDSATVYPADYLGVIGVGATNSQDTLASFSSMGNGVDLTAPGVNIFGAAKGGGYEGRDGTSFACPQVSGAVTLIFSSLPRATTAEVEELLFTTADDLGAPGRDDLYGYGRLNLFRVMRRARFGTLAGFDGETKAIAMPNPYKINPAQRVIFSFPNSVAGGSNPRVQIYDLSGVIIREVDGFSWDGKNAQGMSVVPGVYIFEVRTDRGRSKGRMIVSQ